MCKDNDENEIYSCCKYKPKEYLFYTLEGDIEYSNHIAIFIISATTLIVLLSIFYKG